MRRYELAGQTVAAVSTCTLRHIAGGEVDMFGVLGARALACRSNLLGHRVRRLLVRGNGGQMSTRFGYIAGALHVPSFADDFLCKIDIKEYMLLLKRPALLCKNRSIPLDMQPKSQKERRDRPIRKTINQ